MWERFLKETGVINDTTVSEYLSESLVIPDSLDSGDRLTVDWCDSKGCVIELLSDERFRVIPSSNIKLKPEDTFRLHSLCVGLPFYATDIIRGDEKIAGYIGAKSDGVTSIKIEKHIENQ